MKEETVTLTKEEYKKIKDRLVWLDCLEQAGVDNWEGMEYAQELYQDYTGE